jgi:hypothetical protein
LEFGLSPGQALTPSFQDFSVDIHQSSAGNPQLQVPSQPASIEGGMMTNTNGQPSKLPPIGGLSDLPKVLQIFLKKTGANGANETDQGAQMKADAAPEQLPLKGLGWATKCLAKGGLEISRSCFLCCLHYSQSTKVIISLGLGNRAARASRVTQPRNCGPSKAALALADSLKITWGLVLAGETG